MRETYSAFHIDIFDASVKAFRNLGTGEDDELTAAYAYFHKTVEQEAGAVRNANLAGLEQLKLRAVDIHCDVQHGLAAMDIANENNRTIIGSTGRMDHYLKRNISPNRVLLLTETAWSPGGRCGTRRHLESDIDAQFSQQAKRCV